VENEKVETEKGEPGENSFRGSGQRGREKWAGKGREKGTKGERGWGQWEKKEGPLHKIKPKKSESKN